MAIEKPTIERPTFTKPTIARPVIDRPKRMPAGMMHPSFDTLFEPDDENPLDSLEDTGDIEANVDAELAVALDVLLANKKGKNAPIGWQTMMSFGSLFASKVKSRKTNSWRCPVGSL